MIIQLFIISIAAFYIAGGHVLAQEATGPAVETTLEVETVVPREIKGKYVYSVEFLCGGLTLPRELPAQPSHLATGSYRTSGILGTGILGTF